VENQAGNDSGDVPLPTGRLVAGGSVFIVSFLSPLLIPLVLSANWADSTKAAISGFLAIGAPELGMLLAVAILGKSGFQLLKRVFISSLSRWVFPEQVGPVRHRIGVAMFLLPVLFGWLQPYIAYLFPDSGVQQPLYVVSGDVVFVLSLFVLGGDFWEKLRNLFIR
jgi:hypothetical protein